MIWFTCLFAFLWNVKNWAPPETEDCTRQVSGLMCCSKSCISEITEPLKLQTETNILLLRGKCFQTDGPLCDSLGIGITPPFLRRHAKVWNSVSTFSLSILFLFSTSFFFFASYFFLFIIFALFPLLPPVSLCTRKSPAAQWVAATSSYLLAQLS